MNEVYFNNAQAYVMAISANSSVILGGRRLGKTTKIVSNFIVRNAQSMVGSTGLLVVSSYKIAKKNILPAIFDGFKSMGLIEDVHFISCKTPPKNWKKPILKPESYENIISFYNGSILHIISQEIDSSSNSLTADYIVVDEARKLNYEKLRNETFPANGGTRKHFGHIPYHNGMMIVSDMPYNKKGSWLFDFKDRMDVDVINMIEHLLIEVYAIKQRMIEYIKKGKEYPKYLDNKLSKLGKELSKYRKLAILYKEYSTLENLEVLGESYFRNQKRDLTPAVFQTSILCKRLEKLEEGFYNSINPKEHFYVVDDNVNVDTINHEDNVINRNNNFKDLDLDLFKPIHISFDYNSNINWLVAGQVEYKSLKIINSFFVKYENKIEDLIDKFCDYYKGHQLKEVVYYYDTTAISNSYATHGDDFRNVIIKKFKKNGWSINDTNLGVPMRQVEKHLYIHRLLKNEVENGLRILINKKNNEVLITALQNAGCRNGANGFSKDKTGEKLPETEYNKLEYRTDGTDAFDSLVIGVNVFLKTKLSNDARVFFM